MEPQTSFQPVLGRIFESFTQCRLKYNFCFVESGIQCNKLGFIHAIIQVWDKWCNTISTPNKYPPCIAANVFIVPITSSTLNSKFTKFSCLFKVETWSKWKIIEFLFLRLQFTLRNSFCQWCFFFQLKVIRAFKTLSYI